MVHAYECSNIQNILSKDDMTTKNENVICGIEVLLPISPPVLTTFDVLIYPGLDIHHYSDKYPRRL